MKKGYITSTQASQIYGFSVQSLHMARTQGSEIASFTKKFEGCNKLYFNKTTYDKKIDQVNSQRELCQRIYYLLRDNFNTETALFKAMFPESRTTNTNTYFGSCIFNLENKSITTAKYNHPS